MSQIAATINAFNAISDLLDVYLYSACLTVGLNAIKMLETAMFLRRFNLTAKPRAVASTLNDGHAHPAYIIIILNNLCIRSC